MKITRLAFSLLLGLAVLPVLLVGLVLLVLHQRPVPPLDYPGFDICRLPCWAGITPAEIHTVDSPEMMAMHLQDAELEFSQIATQINFTITGHQQLVQGAIYDDRGMVHSLRLMLQMPLWQLLELLGTPACVNNQPGSANGSMMTIWWVRDKHTVSATLLLMPTDWGPAAAVFTLGSSQQPETCASPLLKPWRGFAPLWFYAPD